MDDAPIVCSNEKPKKTRKVKKLTDPRFNEKPNKSKHLKNYSFLYPKEMIENLKKREERSRLENELVKMGKKKFYMKKKHLKELEDDK